MPTLPFLLYKKPSCSPLATLLPLLPLLQDYSLPSSHCPEEVSWPPLQDGPAGGDCYAAVNLMTMSAKQTAHALAAVAAAAAAGASSGAGSPASVNLLGSASVAGPLLLDPEQFNPDALASLAARCGGGNGGGSGSGSDGASGSAAAHAPPSHHKVAPVDLAELSQCLPPNKVLELVRCALSWARAGQAGCQLTLAATSMYLLALRVPLEQSLTQHPPTSAYHLSPPPPFLQAEPGAGAVCARGTCRQCGGGCSGPGAGIQAGGGAEVARGGGGCHQEIAPLHG